LKCKAPRCWHKLCRRKCVRFNQAFLPGAIDSDTFRAMSFWSASLRLFGFGLLACTLTACLPSTDGSLDEQKDPHYLNGRARVSSLDYKGAIQEFEKALEANPHSGAAHLELALLYQDQMKDYAAAIYHYERHLKYQPHSEYLDRATERVRTCKMELVRSEVIGPVTQGMQRDMERLMTENMLLKQRVETLEAQLNNRPAPAPRVDHTVPQAQQPVTQNVALTQTHSTVQPAVRRDPAPPPARQSRTYVVKQGDKLHNIALKYGVELSRLMQANPGVDPARLKIGQTINIP
jgi:LysM repeat protein